MRDEIRLNPDEARLADALECTPENQVKINALRSRLRDEFASRNGLSFVGKVFEVEALSPYAFDRMDSPAMSRYPLIFDHVEYAVDDFDAPRLISCHPYGNETNIRASALELEHELRVWVHLPPSPVDGWYWPGRAIPVFITRPGFDLNFAGERRYVFRT